MSHFDTVVHSAEIVTMDAERSVVHGWLGIRDGLIVAREAGEAPEATGRAIDAAGGIVHPGYVSAHQHSMDALGRAEHGEALPFFDWLFGVYYRGVLTMHAADAREAAALTAHDLIRAGVTTVLDCWGVGDPGGERSAAAFAATVEVARASGLRWLLAPMVADRVPADWQGEPAAAAARAGFALDRVVTSTERALDAVRAARALVADEPRLRVWAAPELPELASDALIEGLAAIAREGGSGFTTHLCASPASAAGSDGVRSVTRLAGLGAFEHRALGAHLSDADAGDLASLAALGVGAAHCPSASMLGGGTRSALGALRQAGVTTGLGLDNASLGATADMAAEMRHALMFDRSSPTGDERLTPRDAFALATIEGARALGLDREIGSLEVGKRADVVVLDTSGRHWSPRREPASGIVFQQCADDVRWVLVDGEVLLEGGRVVPALPGC